MKFISQFCQFFYIVSISVHGRCLSRRRNSIEDGVLKQFEKSGPWNALTQANDADVHKLKLAFKKLALAKILYHQKQPEIQFGTNNIYGVISEILAPNYVDHIPRYTNSLLHRSMLPSEFTSLIIEAARLRNDYQIECGNIEGIRRGCGIEIVHKLVYEAKFLFLKELKTSIFEAFDETFEAKKRLFDRLEAFWNRKFNDFQVSTAFWNKNRVWATWNYHGRRFEFHSANFDKDLGEMKELIRPILNERID